MIILPRIDKQEWIKKLQSEGFNDFSVRPLPPCNDHEEHNHEYDQANIILSGELTIFDKNGTKTYFPGERIDVAAGTIHKAKGGPEGGEMLTGLKKK